MRNICSKFLRLLAVVLATGLGISSHAQVQLVWTVGLDDNGWPVGDGGGPNTSFVQETGAINPLPGSPTSPEVNQQADNDYYFAGAYSTVIAGNGAYVPVGVVAANEEAAERAFAAADNDLRYHFNLPNSLRPFDLLSVTFDALNLDDPTAVNTDRRYGIEVYFNGVLVQTQIVIRPAQLGIDYTTPQFSLASVNAQVGPGFDNIVSLRGINYNAEGGGNWMGIDYVRLDAAPGPGVLPNVLNIGQNKVGSVTNHGNGAFTIVGGGNDIWDQRDEFTYAYTEVTGDFDVQVRVASLTASANWPKAGIMARESLSEYSRMAFARVTSDQPPGVNDVRFAYRTGLDNVNGASGGQHEDGGGNPSGIPNAWLRLARIGNTMYMSNSADGIAWNLVSSQDTTAWGGGALSNKLFVGLGVSRHPSATTPTVTAEFLNFQFNSNSAPFAVVAAESRGNPNGVRVIFNNPVGTGGQTPGNYTLTTVSGPNVTTVTGVRFTTANDSPNRDPLTYTLEGTTGDPAVGGWELIASGDTGLATDPGRNTVGPTVNFANAKEYRAYRVLFPTVRDAATANSMQISEIELLDAGGADVTAPGDAVVGVRAIAGSSVSEVAVAGGSGNTFPANENPANAIDNATGTKYLNFAKLNTGIIVTPSGGAQPANPSVSAAGAGPNDPTIQLATSQLVEGATYELLVDSTVLAADGTSLVSAVATFTHGAGYEPRRIQVAHNKTDDHGYYQVSDAVAKGIGDVVQIGGGVFSPVETNSVFEDPIPDLVASNERFSSRISGVLVAPTTGNYIFYWSSDDNGHLYLSSDASPANKVLIASEPAWNGRREYINGGNQATRGTPPANISVPIALTAGKQYYLEGIATEGGGGNNSSATWLPPGGPAVANGTSPIADTNFVPSRLFDGNTFNTLGPVRIISQPTNLTVVALTPATFRVALDGTPGYIYQWRRNGVPIPGANGPTYTITAAQLVDDQAVFSAVVANEFSSAVSGSATLTVLVPTPPHLLSANADVTFSNVVVHFDNRLEVASAQNIANYTLTNAAGPLTIISATRAANFRDVVLRIATTMPEDTPHTLIVRDIHDETGTTTLQSNPTNTTFLSFAFAPGYVQRQQHLGPTADYGAGSVDQYITDFRAGAAILRGECLANTFEYNQSDIGLPGFPGRPNNYGGRIAGYFTPPVNGDYTFYIAADDFARLLLSTDANPANVAVVAREPVWSARRTWTGEASGGGRGTPPANIYTATGLVGGQRYFMEAFFTEGGGGDNLGVDIQGPGDPVPNIGDAPRGGAYFGTYVQPGNLAITTQPQNQMKTENAFATFTVAATSSSTICGGDTIGYQWRSNGVPIVGANTSSLTIGPVSLVNSGDVYSVIVTAPARSVTSANALLSVTADHVPPVLLSVRGNGCNDGSSTRIFLNWNELIAANPAEEEGSYRVFAPGLSEIAVSLATLVNGSNVVLDLATPMVGGGVYSVEAGFQTDLAGNQTDKVGSPTVDVAHGVVSLVGFSLGFGTNASGQIVIEAENYGGIDSPVGTSSWLLGTTPIGNGSISGNYMYSSPDAGVSIAAPPLNGFAPRLDYCVNLPAAGTWYVWARGCGIDGAANSVHMGIDGVDSPNGQQLGNFNALWDGNTWNWSSDTTVSPAQFSVASAGTHTFNIWMREDGVRVDRFLLTQDPAFTFPNRTVIGPAETPIGGGGSRPVLTISRSGGQITLTWSGTFCLQEADTVTGPWVTSARVNGTPFTPPTTGNKFYRLIDVCP